MSEMYWFQGKNGVRCSGPHVINEIKKCKNCGQGKYSSTRAVTIFCRGNETWRSSSRLAKRGEDGRWLGLSKDTGEYDRLLPEPRDKPELPCECVSRSGRIPKRLVNRYLLPLTPTPRHPLVHKDNGTFPKESSGGVAGTFRPRRSSTVQAATSTDNSGDGSAGISTKKNRPDFRPRTPEQVETSQANAEQELAAIGARLEEEALAREERENVYYDRRTC